MINGNRDRDALWNVVNGDGHHNGDGDAGVLQGGDKGGQSLGKVMDGDGQGGHHPHAHQLGCVAGVRFQRLDLMGIFLGGNALVNESDQEHPAEKGDDRAPAAPFLPQFRLERILGLGKNLDHGDINHDASGKAQADGQEFFVGMVGQKCDAASNPSAQPGQEGEKKSVENRVIHRIPPLMI